ncbi:hypothetical protein DOTSEDRAFT_30904 [Dothistroma septosporum NZE10]|uniref:Uncharacterized protein n=1 Tax=Dothistroma septosporum (strain NZE10 / CBS 128990) TaxID=675120 RepID=N1Q1U6_DOTSN|nr:hypothetical protein DOTSEDRAFT_30904 [Dothistroma septosporum NZE10]
MVLYDYDAPVYNAVQGSKHCVAYFNSPDAKIIGAVDTAYTVGAIVAGFSTGGDCVVSPPVILAGELARIRVPHVLWWQHVLHTIPWVCRQNSAAGSIYIGERAPSKVTRGQIMTFWRCFCSVGSFIAYWINFACSKHVKRPGKWD